MNPFHSTSRHRTHIHFGAGKLGIGLVLPVLNQIGNTLVVQQSRQDAGGFKWDDIANGGRILFRSEPQLGSYKPESSAKREMTLAPYKEWFRCLRVKWNDGDVTDKMLHSVVPRALIVVDHFKQVENLLQHADSLSCSIGDGQGDLADLLQGCMPKSSKVPVLAFENTLSGKLRAVQHWSVSHVISDRICGDRRLNLANRQLLVRCEIYASVVADSHYSECFNSNLIGRWRCVHLVDSSDLPFHAAKKRALVNSLHQLVAILCFRALSEQNLPIVGQYLPIVMAWFAKEYPEFYHSVETYKRLRVLKLTWPLIKRETFSAEAVAAINYYGNGSHQEIYDLMLQEVHDVLERFSHATDELSRLINPANLRKELWKYREHILGPVDFMWAHHTEIIACALYDKPNFCDLEGLENILTESFLAAMEKAMISPMVVAGD